LIADLDRAGAGAGLDQIDIAAGIDQTCAVDSGQTASAPSDSQVEALNDHTTEATDGADETERQSADVELPLDVPVLAEITAKIQRAEEAIAAQRAEAQAADEAYRKQREADYDRGPEAEGPAFRTQVSVRQRAMAA
jgi:hypothetical protein